MAGLCVMAVILTFLMSAEKSLADVDPGRLATFVNGIKTRYGTPGMYSLAVSIRDNLNLNPNAILENIFAKSPADLVKNTMNNGQVYNNFRVVAAKKVDRYPDHAESRVVTHLNDLLNRNSKDDLLLFYVYASPCRQTCIDNPNYNILSRIQKIKDWSNYAFVFTKPYKNTQNPNAMTVNDRHYVLTKLRDKIGLNNIFRCDTENGWMTCTRCSNGGNVAHYCIS